MKHKRPPPPRLVQTSYLPEQIPQLRGPAVLLLGRSNAGKSSLLNVLLKMDLAKVSKSPGKTRSVNFYRWGDKLTLVDVPGYGFALRSLEERRSWRELMESFFEKVPAASLSLLLLDAKRDPESEELALIEALCERGFPVELLLTKADRLLQAERERRRRAMLVWSAEPGREIPLTWRFVSAKTGEGIDELGRRLLKYAQAFPL